VVPAIAVLIGVTQLHVHEASSVVGNLWPQMVPSIALLGLVVTTGAWRLRRSVVRRQA
jgi:hypothetical protein